MRVVFMGSAEMSCPSLKALSDQKDIEVVAAVTQPDRPRGRNLKLCACDVKILAEELSIPVVTPENINDSESVAVLEGFNADLFAVVAYGQILKQEVLDMPRKGCVNIHASILPAYRGAAPIQWAIARGESVTGVTSMYMNASMDEGDIILTSETDVTGHDTASSLHDRLKEIGASLLIDTMRLISEGNVNARPQDAQEASYAPKISKEDGRIDWTLSADEIERRVRAFNPWPVCTCSWGDKKIRVLASSVKDISGNSGVVLDLSDEGPIIGAGERSLCLTSVQPEGRKVMTGHAYVCGHALKKGDVLA